MSRDYKPAKQRPPAIGKARGGTLLGIFIGLIVGVGAAAAVVWYMNKTPSPFVPNKTGAEAGRPAAAPSAPAPLPGKPGDAPVEKRFQFYDILPGKSEPKPDVRPDDAAHPGAEPPAADLHVQAGSFQNARDADNLRATLALSGLEAGVQQVMVGDKVWYRVRLGPYARPDDAGKVKAELAKMGIEASVIKGKD